MGISRMITGMDCYPCYFKIVHLLETEPERQERLTEGIKAQLNNKDLQVPPPVISGDIWRWLKQEMKVEDPFARLKTLYTEKALSIYPRLRKKVLQSEYPFQMAARLAVAGNIIDFGAFSTKQQIPLEEEIEAVLESPFEIDHSAELETACREAQTILYLADNTGELVLDRLLLEQCGPEKVLLVVRGLPILNDATLEDVSLSGIGNEYKVIGNGSDIPGTWLQACNPPVRNAFEQFDVVISKGQGNYETLSQAERDVFFLFKAKCSVVAKDVGCPEGARLIIHSRNNKAFKNLLKVSPSC